MSQYELAAEWIEQNHPENAAAAHIAGLLRLASKSQVPAGWRLVPKEPTDAMLQAGADNIAGFLEYLRKGDAGIPGADGVYRAMLSSAPSPTPIVEDKR